jgi:effector-binding domain-containing protein
MSKTLLIEREQTMPADYVVKTIPAVRLVGRTATIAAQELAEHIGPMFDAVGRALTAVGASLETPIATYSEGDDGMDVVVGYACSASPPSGTEVIDLPAASAVCGTHLGPMTGIHESWQHLQRWVVQNGYEFAGPCRELYVKAVSDDQSDWVTELEQPVAAG